MTPEDLAFAKQLAQAIRQLNPEIWAHVLHEELSMCRQCGEFDTGDYCCYDSRGYD